MAFGVLTTNSVEEALARAGDGPDNKGWEAAAAAIEMAGDCRAAYGSHRDDERDAKDPRHRAREAALQMLYQWEIGAHRRRASGGDVFFELQWPDEEPPPDELRGFAGARWRATRSSGSGAIDALIADDRPSAGGPSGWRSSIG